ncbi:Hypothetical protein PSM36_1216 [Proteiniphilum saccharofermentans]|uniref:Uncharacterized protein n=1 Tax=Proteiniphilum saccharofermentans TaxID=1642647 RepID=A0A1R3SYQ8_9BACT|nr:Hypothetical protein PSM36_1216 [Proteiniphilum saccharofermentans]SDZ88169.1 hypothetical protein SAMN05216331_10881 [Porphyromonadaceae bacterium KH3R12]SFS95111.1 hypothetical protein SAMN05216365_1343 [Porphyromonadaceae bacterium NLAE-zl-C104]
MVSLRKICQAFYFKLFIHVKILTCKKRVPLGDRSHRLLSGYQNRTILLSNTNSRQVHLDYIVTRTISISEHRGKTCFDYVKRRNSAINLKTTDVIEHIFAKMQKYYENKKTLTPILYFNSLKSQLMTSWPIISLHIGIKTQENSLFWYFIFRFGILCLSLTNKMDRV